MSSGALVLIGCLIIVILAVLKVPIWISLLCGTVFIQHFCNHMSLNGLLVTLVENLNKSSLMCVPFFMLVGTIVQQTTMGERLLNFCIILLRKIKGGLAVASVVANGLFGAISGSSGAAVALFGKIVYKPLKETYDEDISLGIITTSATLSGIIPPSITFIMYGVTASTSVAKLFAAGVIPGILIVLCCCVYLMFRLNRMEKKGTFTPSKVVYIGDIQDLTFRKAFLMALPVFVLPVIVFVGIYSGIFTPTEASAISALYCLICGFGLGDIKLKSSVTIFKSAIKTIVSIITLFTAASAFAQAITIAQLPQLVSALFESFNKIQFLLFLNVLLLIVGCLIDATPAILIFVPILMPTAVALGIDLVQLGVIFTINLSIGFFTPPFGMNLFICQGVTHAGIGKIIHACVPYIFIYLALVLLFTYVPWFSMFLPGII